MIGPFSIGALLLFAAWLMANPQTRSPASIGVAVLVTGAIVGAQVIFEPSPLRYAIQGAAFAGGFLVGWVQPAWIRPPPLRFADQYKRADEAARRLVVSAELAWQAGEVSVDSRIVQFDRAIATYMALEPPTVAWAHVIAERCELLRTWRDIIEDPDAHGVEALTVLHEREIVLGERVRRLAAGVRDPS